jgi:hypothetical protein
MEQAAREGREGGLLLWNPKRVGYGAWSDRLAHPAWQSDFCLTDVAGLWQGSFSPHLWDAYRHRMGVIERLGNPAIDEFRAAGLAPLTVVVEECQAVFQVLEAQDTKTAKAITSDLNVMSALFRASGIRLILVSQAMTAEGGISTKTKTNATAKLHLGPADAGGYFACFGQQPPQDFAAKYRPVLGSGIFQCPHLGTRVVQVGFP